MKVTLYLSHKDGSLKEREATIGNALKSGFEKHGDQVAIVPTHEFIRPDWESQLAVVIGVKGHSKKIFEEYRRGGRQVMLVDKSYFGRTEYVRLSVGGFQPPYAHAAPRADDRWRKIRDEFRINVQPLRTSGSFLIYAGSSQKYCDWHGLGDVSDFAEGVCNSISKFSGGMKLLYRPKPSWVAGHPNDVRHIAGTKFSGPDVKLGVLLPSCRALITHGSNAAVEAVIAGVPVVVRAKGSCAAEPVADLDTANVIAPRFPSDAERLQWLADLAYCQFNMTELADGTAWAIKAPHTMKAGLETYAGMSPQDSVIAQYRAMHESAKMFRGSSIKGHVEALCDLVAQHKPKSLLDYGSGKGTQYSERLLHEKWGGLLPVCYDPGYPPIATKPEGQFDGVICTDVAEHWLPECVDDLLSDVIGYAKQFAFFCVYTEPSRKYLPDGRNVHLTCRPQAWWIARIAAVTNGKVERTFDISKPIAGGGYEKFPHTVIRAQSGVEVVVTFRGYE